MPSMDDPAEPTALPIRKKQPKQQLTKGMEHMRSYVTIDSPPTQPQPQPSPQIPPEQDNGADAYGVPATYAPLRKPLSPSPSTENPHHRTDPFQFGTRYLGENDDIFSHNAWDHVEIDPSYSTFIDTQVTYQRTNAVSPFDKTRFNTSPEKWWDKFYSNNNANFFKDRKWLVQEFPVLGDVTRDGYGDVTVLEVGAGAGNTAFPVLERNANGGLRLWACDYSRKAVDVIRGQEAYKRQEGEGQVLRAHVWDVAGVELPEGLEEGSVDVVVMIFIFSALAPDQWAAAVGNIWRLLKPGGQVLFRDYGRGDLAQVRFKKGRYLEENFYVRGDGTRVYFFEEQELRDIWSGKHASQSEHAFEIANVAVDRRMLVNRQRKLKMYRCWLQGLFRKPMVNSTG